MSSTKAATDKVAAFCFWTRRVFGLSNGSQALA